MKKRPGTKRKPHPGPRTKAARPTTSRPAVPPSQRPRPAGDDSARPSPASLVKKHVRGAAAPGRRNTPAPPPMAAEVVHVVPAPLIARIAVSTAEEVEHNVLGDFRRADRTLSAILRRHRGLGPSDQRFIAEAVFALFRWKGWVDRLGMERTSDRLFASWLLDSPSFHPASRVWAREAGFDPERVVPLGDAPSWTALAEGFKRSIGGPSFSADPWALFPDWLRDHLPNPNHGADYKRKNLELLFGLQKRPPLWLRAQNEPPEKVWEELHALGIKPWAHRTVAAAAKVGTDADVYHLAPFLRGSLEIQDLASQAVGLACDPEPGERWWDACAGAGGKSIQLAALMNGKGVVIATDSNERRLAELARRCRRSPYRNVSGKAWSGKHTAGKPKSFDGVLVDAPCSAIGTWRRNPEARWSTDADAVARLADLQWELLNSAAAGVKKGGTLVYSVCTFTPTETTGVVERFLKERPEFQLQPFPHPLTRVEVPGTLLILPHEADTDAMYVAKMTLAGAPR